MQSEKKSKKKKKSSHRLLTILLVLFLIFMLLPDDEEDYEDGGSGTFTPSAVDIDTKPDENLPDTGAESATILIYMIGSDLESENGCATSDIAEMCRADLGDSVNVVIQTGGAKKWQNSAISAKSVQRFTIENGKLNKVDDLGKMSMVKKDTLTDFLRWGLKNYPADRTGVIFWNHGGGTALGFGSDEYYPKGTITLDDFQEAFHDAKAHVEFVGFDACLMGTVETAYALSDYADYLIASEETEPGSGWYYTDWLTMLGRNPGVNMETLGKKIIHDFVDGPDASFWDSNTLSLIRLDKIPALYDILTSYMGESHAVLANQGYSYLARARSKARSFGSGGYEQIDIISYLNQADIDGADEVRQALNEAIVHSESTVSDANGLAMYYPYEYPNYYSTMFDELLDIGMDDDYLQYFSDFVSLLVRGGNYGRSVSKSSVSLAAQVTDYTDEVEDVDYTGESWYSDTIEVDESAALAAEKPLTIVEEDGHYVIKLTEEQKDTISYAEMSLFIDDGEGYLDLGTDTAVDFMDNGDLSADFDSYWLSIDGEQVVPYITLDDVTGSDGKWHSTGYIPATLNGDRDIHIIVYWDDDNLGIIKGYCDADFQSDDMTFPARALSQLEEGDQLQLYCDYYGYDGTFNASYYVGDPITVGADGLKTSYIQLNEDETAVIAFHLRDLYQTDYWTESMTWN